MEDATNTLQEAPASAIPEAQSEQVATADQVAATPETQASDTAGETPLLAGKFKSVTDMEASYKELERKFHEERQQRSSETPVDTGSRTVAPDLGNDLPFDPDTVQGLSTFYTRMRQAERAAEETQKAIDWQRRNADVLKDPLLTSRIASIIKEGNDAGMYVERDTALAQAQRELDERIRPQVRDAQATGFDEGVDVALRKQQAGAVGDTSVKNAVKDDTQLSAKEFAEKYGLSRS